MVKASKVEETYQQYRRQIDTIFLKTGKNLLKTAKLVSWFYGGSPETWRKFLAKLTVKSPDTKIVDEFLEKMTKEK